MAVNLSFVTHDEDFASRGDSNGRSMVKNVFGKSLSEEIITLYGSPPPSCWERRSSEVVTSFVHSHPLPKNVSLPTIVPPDDQPVRTSVRRRAPVENRPVHVLRRKSDNCSSDSEVTVKSKETNHVRSNSSDYRNVENRQSSINDQLRSSEPSPLGKDQGSIATGHQLYTQLAATPTCKRSPLASPNHPADCEKPAKSRRDYFSLSETLTDGSLPQEVKRAKSFFSISPTTQRKSPAVGRRKSPYKELDIAVDQTAHEKLSSIGHLPPRSPRTHRPSSTFIPSELQASLSFEYQKKYKLYQKVTKPSLTDGWRPVSMSFMMANQYISPNYDEQANGSAADISSSRDEPVNLMVQGELTEFDVLKVAPDEFAKQLTLLDLDAFKAIAPDEITSCGWVKKEKWKQSPNVCTMTQRFNNTSFWVIREVLNASSLKHRVDIITHFIKIAKKLFEVNNFHSLMAVIQSLNSTPVIRLSKTWTVVPKNQKSQFDRLLVLVREDENRSELRTHMQDIKLPCIPFLGMYLTDIIYIDAAHPYKGGIESHERTNKMNNVLRILADYQQSTYNQFSINRPIRDYLKSVTYIEELQKFLEEDNYKLSLKIEPIQPNSSPEKKQKIKAEVMADLGMSSKPNDRLDVCNLPSRGNFSPGHRKTRSLGKEGNFSSAMKPKSENSQNKSGSLPRNTFPSVTTSLLDDSIIATTSSGQMALHPVSSGSIRSSLSNSASDHSEQEDISWTSEQLKKGISLSDRNKLSVQWVKVHQGSREKFSLKPIQEKMSVKCSTYPLEKNSSLRSVYQSYISEHGLHDASRIVTNESYTCDVVKTPSKFSDEDDDRTALICNRPLPNRAKTSASQRALKSVSSLSVHVTEQVKGWRHVLKSPRMFRRRSKSMHSIISSLGGIKPVLECSFDSTNIEQAAASHTESGSGSLSKFEGCVRRKCVLKHGKKPSVSTFTRYWMALYDTTLVFYAAKAVRATERQHYKTQFCKKMSVYGWTLLRSTDPDKQEYFQLRDPKETTVYRFHCDSTDMALVWMSVLEEATKGRPQIDSRLEQDLINLDDS